MATEYGKDWRIMIGDGVEGTEGFDPLGGEGSFDFKRASDQIDLSSKDDAAYKAQGWGQQSVTISVTGNVKLPDPGLERCSDIAKASPPELNIKIMKGAVVKFHGRVGLGNFGYSAAKDGPVSYSLDFTAVAAPTVDDMVATA